MGFYKDDKTHVVSINPDARPPKPAPKAPADLTAAFAAGAMSGKGRGIDPVQPTVVIATGRKRPR